MDATTRKQKADFTNNLVKLLTDCENDTEFYNRLVWTLEKVSNEISRFTSDEVMR